MTRQNWKESFLEFKVQLDGLISPKKPEDFRFPEGPT
jgi:hypothetical protein